VAQAAEPARSARPATHHNQTTTTKNRKRVGKRRPKKPHAPAIAAKTGILDKHMEVQALTRYARMSPKKMREVSRTIQGRTVTDARNLLSVITRKSARLIAKTLNTAVANAENNHNLASDNLTIKLAVIENGPVLKRFKAGARGSAKPRRKKMSHIRIVLTDGEDNN
jgi:large subunit ribosomal protein L22